MPVAGLGERPPFGDAGLGVEGFEAFEGRLQFIRIRQQVRIGLDEIAGAFVDRNGDGDARRGLHSVPQARRNAAVPDLA